MLLINNYQILLTGFKLSICFDNRVWSHFHKSFVDREIHKASIITFLTIFWDFLN